ncbi:MAG: trypsin-like peptidase domain-containing protein, partial [Planctomycetes bacterium]|nr:trypsin-like peptidase domain-containing protein [Planctomycetota bacterium]
QEDELLESEKNTISIYNRAAPSVLHITNTRRIAFPWFHDPVAREVRQGTGSGFVWDRKGHIVTNYHVIHGASKLFVKMIDGASFDAEVVGTDPDTDVAVLRLKAPTERLAKLQPLAVGRSRDLKVGQKVLAIGNPFGFDVSLSTGVVSALGRRIQSLSNRTIENVIQTDAAINPGNSGGPLLDSRGRLIGINTAIVSPSGAYAGIGFAVPSDTVARVVPRLLEQGEMRTPGLGVSVLPDTYARTNNIRGVIIGEVLPGSAAAQAGLIGVREDAAGGLYLGDVIVSIASRPVETLDDLHAALDRFKVGDVVEIGYTRGGDPRVRTASVRLQPVRRS